MLIFQKGGCLMSYIRQQYEEDIVTLEDLKRSAIILITKTPQAVFMNAKHNTVPYKKMISALNRISVKLDELNIDIDLDKNGLFMLSTALQRENIGDMVYKGAISDIYHRWVGFLKSCILKYTTIVNNLKKQESHVESSQEKIELTKQVEASTQEVNSNRDNSAQELENIESAKETVGLITKQYLNTNDIQLDTTLNLPVSEDYSLSDLQEVFTVNMNKILSILNSGQLTYGIPSFDNILLYISNIYEVFKTFKFDKGLISKTEMQLLRKVRICSCHNLYKDNSALVEVCAAIGILVTLAYKLK